MLRIVGSCDQRLFGLSPSERLRRQRRSTAGPILVAHASAVLSDVAIDWLMEHKGVALATPSGRAVAITCAPEEAEEAQRTIAQGHAPETVNPAQMEPMFIRKLRRRDTLLVRSLEENPVRAIERELFDSVYKGVTDVVTKYAWPLPAFLITRLSARLGVAPNAITLAGIVAAGAVAVLWAEGEIALGLLLAWLMTFLDTVDGKLARVTVTSSWLGNLLDHVTDFLHPPLWWVCLAIGLSAHDPLSEGQLWAACALILVGYVVGRLVEELFKRRIGYNAYLWRPFDSAFRLIVSRRNIILLIMTGGLLMGQATAAYLTAAAWTLVSVAVQVVRFAQACRAERRGAAETWLK